MCVCVNRSIYIYTLKFKYRIYIEGNNHLSQIQNLR